MKFSKKATALTAGVSAAFVAVVGIGFGITQVSSASTADQVVTAATYEAGGLKIESGEATAMLLPVEGQEGEPAPVDLATFKMVPGDAIEVTQPLVVTLVGDDLVAEIDNAELMKQLTGGAEGANEYVELTTELRGADGTALGDKVRFTTKSSDAATAGDIAVDAEGKATVTLYAKVWFKAATPERVLTTVNLATFGDAKAVLRQVAS